MPPESSEVWSLDSETFHSGELFMQRKANVADEAAAIAPLIRDYLPDQHRAFYARLNTLHVGTIDEQGRVWAGALAGPAGFLSSGQATELSVAPGSQLPDDPARLIPGRPFGALGLDLASRRRNRANGTVAAVAADGALHLRCETTVGNCPKYIQTRHVRLDPARLAAQQRGQAPAGAVAGSGALGPRQVALIRTADTFFLATYGGGGGGGGGRDGCHTAAAGAAPSQEAGMTSPSNLANNLAAAAAASGGPPRPHAGCDISHRGGPPGFVECSDDGLTLRWPDYAGNNFFMSLGNLHVYPSSGLLFIDWLSGDSLQLTGRAEVLHDDRSMPGAQRAVRFATTAWRWVPGGLPILAAPVVERSPFNPAVPRSCRPSDPSINGRSAGSGSSATALAGSGGEAAGPRTLVECVAVRDEAEGIKTFAFRAPPNFAYTAGQYATFELEVPGGARGGSATVNVNRTWTISSHPAETAATGTFTISVKRVGAASAWLHDTLVPSVGGSGGGGPALRLCAVGGDFVAAAPAGGGGNARPALLLAGGIGITPLRTIFKQLTMQRAPAAALVYSVRRPEEAAFLPELESLAEGASAATASAAAGGGSCSGSAHASAAACGGTVGQASAAPSYRVLATVTAAGVAGTAASSTAAGGGSTRGGDHSTRGSSWRRGRVGAALLAEAVGQADRGTKRSTASSTSSNSSSTMVQLPGSYPDLSGWDVYLCGPPAFMAAMEALLAACRADPARIFSESFAF